MVISKSQAQEISIQKLPLARAPVLPLRQHGPLTHLPNHESHDKRQNWTRISGNVRKSFTSIKILQNKQDISHKLPLNYHILLGVISPIMMLNTCSNFRRPAPLTTNMRFFLRKSHLQRASTSLALPWVAKRKDVNLETPSQDVTTANGVFSGLDRVKFQWVFFAPTWHLGSFLGGGLDSFLIQVDVNFSKKILGTRLKQPKEILYSQRISQLDDVLFWEDGW